MFHELAHAAEFGPDQYRRRSTQHGFVFRNRQTRMGGQIFADPRTTQSIERELRTFAHQYHLLRSAGVPVELEVFAQARCKPMAFMPDWLLVPGGEGNWDERESERRAYCARRIQQYVAEISAGDTIARMTGWLDRVHRSLRRLKFEAPASSTYTRTLYRGEGSAFAVVSL